MIKDAMEDGKKIAFTTQRQIQLQLKMFILILLYKIHVMLHTQDQSKYNLTKVYSNIQKIS